jgi:hypothetical protein
LLAEAIEHPGVVPPGENLLLEGKVIGILGERFEQCDRF